MELRLGLVQLVDSVRRLGQLLLKGLDCDQRAVLVLSEVVEKAGGLLFEFLEKVHFKLINWSDAVQHLRVLKLSV